MCFLASKPSWMETWSVTVQKEMRSREQAGARPSPRIKAPGVLGLSLGGGRNPTQATMVKKTSYCDILDMKPNSSSEEIKQACHKVALKYPPNKDPREGERRPPMCLQ